MLLDAIDRAILGALQSNGRVFLINPNGITIGAGASIDVAGFVASTLNMSDGDFIAGRMRFSQGHTAAGAVVIGDTGRGVALLPVERPCSLIVLT